MDRIIKQDELSDRMGVTRQTLYNWEKNGQMPKRFKLAKDGRAVGWLESEIEDWISERVAARELEGAEK